MSTNPIRSPRVDLNVWLVQSTGLIDLVSIPMISLCIDLAILILPCIILYRILNDKKIHKLATLLCVLFGFYILIIYCFPTLSIRKYLGLILIPIAFTFTSKDRFTAYLELMRYYILFVFTSASLWKILRGVAWDPNHMQLSLKGQHIDNFINWPDHYITQTLSTFIGEPSFCFWLFLSAVIFQLSFSIGFFTKKYDNVLALLLIIFIVSDYLVMRIEYWEFIVFLPLLLTQFRSQKQLTKAVS